MAYSQPVECGLNKSSVDALAADVARQVGYEPGADLIPIVKQLGGRIAVNDVWDVSDATSGSITVEENGSFVIALASHTGMERDRFTIAHELGHYVLHYLWPRHNGKSVGAMEARRYGSGRVEWEANWFAAGFLMPAELFKSAWVELDGVLGELADRFGVSTEAARIRAETLGLK
ncbi:ImmA/IrrE family metallo-endopeptidase [Sinorhizobium terangae]|uniref:ImmA/IrrE family metallo-endopeptidase n=1 Tax=Sinorhizobium terangae TaxID=110322 RepID=UPI0024B14247|nr:ImmA/IrrE family metallo-endopeptidase [Sinorhizobium terangae]WFU47311.1 ImmA/IrrE family metallo-endopeptidase [Sinorhizobium terangae]